MEDLELNDFGHPGEEEGGTAETSIDDGGIDYGEDFLSSGFNRMRKDVLETRAHLRGIRDSLNKLRKMKYGLEVLKEMKEEGEGSREKEEERRKEEEEERRRVEGDKKSLEDSDAISGIRALRDRVGYEGYRDGLTTTHFLRRVYGDRLPDYQDPFFLEHMIKERDLVATKEGDTYKIQFLGEPEREGGRNVYPHRVYEAGLGGEVEDFEGLSRDLASAYDNWRGEILKNKVKKASVIGGVVLSIAGIITGLSLGLRRTGNEMVHDSEVKWSKLTPAEKKGSVIPWTEIEKAGGKAVIAIGEYLYVIIGGTIVYYITGK